MARSVIIVSGLVSTVGADYFVPYAAEQAAMWQEHKANVQPDLLGLSVQDDHRRFTSFLDNLKVADARNALEAEGGGDPVHGPTKFSSLTQGEFEKLLLLDGRPEPSALLAQAVDGPLFNPGVDGALAQDWSGLLTSPVRDQKDCASGWAFAAAAQIEADAQRTLGVRYTLSPQQMLACDTHSDYCSGGWPEAAYAYVRRSGGVEREASYPYASSGGGEPSCRAAADDFVLGLDAGPAATVARATRQETESAMAAHVNATGPLAVCVDATTWGTYAGGVLAACGGGRRVVNHCLQVVGVAVRADGSGWWRLRNSWGSDWGEAGHVRLAFGRDTCGVTHRPSFVRPAYAAAVLRQARDGD